MHPAGYVSFGEDVLTAAKRELLEETGYLGSNFYLIDEYYPSIGFCDEKISVVLATGCKYVQDQDLDSDEFVKYFMVKIDDFKYLFDNNYIIDATTRVAYYSVLDYLSSNNLLDIIGRCDD